LSDSDSQIPNTVHYEGSGASRRSYRNRHANRKFKVIAITITLTVAVSIVIFLFVRNSSTTGRTGGKRSADCGLQDVAEVLRTNKLGLVYQYGVTNLPLPYLSVPYPDVTLTYEGAESKSAALIIVTELSDETISKQFEETLITRLERLARSKMCV
jgi:hypothetical protein